MISFLFQRFHLSFFILILMISASSGKDESTAQDQKTTFNSIEETINEMKLPHEAIAHGTEQYEWGKYLLERPLEILPKITYIIHDIESFKNT